MYVSSVVWNFFWLIHVRNTRSSKRSSNSNKGRFFYWRRGVRCGSIEQRCQSVSGMALQSDFQSKLFGGYISGKIISAPSTGQSVPCSLVCLSMNLATGFPYYYVGWKEGDEENHRKKSKTTPQLKISRKVKKWSKIYQNDHFRRFYDRQHCRKSIKSWKPLRFVWLKV